MLSSTMLSVVILRNIVLIVRYAQRDYVEYHYVSTDMFNVTRLSVVAPLDSI